MVLLLLPFTSKVTKKLFCPLCILVFKHGKLWQPSIICAAVVPFSPSSLSAALYQCNKMPLALVVSCPILLLMQPQMHQTNQLAQGITIILNATLQLNKDEQIMGVADSGGVWNTVETFSPCKHHILMPKSNH
jgi:hypothetical protein